MEVAEGLRADLEGFFKDFLAFLGLVMAQEFEAYDVVSADL